MLAIKDRLRIRMLSYASRLLVQGLNNKAMEVAGDYRLANREIEVARELLDILNETGDSKHVRNSRNLPNR